MFKVVWVFDSFAVPSRCFSVVLPHASSVLISKGKVVLCIWFALFSRLTIAKSGPCEIHCQTKALLVHVSKSELCICIALLCCLTVPDSGLLRSEEHTSELQLRQYL